MLTKRVGCTAAPSPLRLVYVTTSGHNPPLTPQAAGARAAAGLPAVLHSSSLPLQTARASSMESKHSGQKPRMLHPAWPMARHCFRGPGLS
eukprot:527966-Prymnesium_polylepis.1